MHRFFSSFLNEAEPIIAIADEINSLLEVIKFHDIPDHMLYLESEQLALKRFSFQSDFVREVLFECFEKDFAAPVIKEMQRYAAEGRESNTKHFELMCSSWLVDKTARSSKIKRLEAGRHFSSFLRCLTLHRN